MNSMRPPENTRLYREFVERFGPQAAETAIRFYRIEQTEDAQAE